MDDSLIQSELPTGYSDDSCKQSEQLKENIKLLPGLPDDRCIIGRAATEMDSLKTAKNNP